MKLSRLEAEVATECPRKYQEGTSEAVNPSVDWAKRDGRVGYITQGRQRAQSERAAKLAAYRGRLAQEVVLDGTASQEWLIQSAAASALEIDVLTSRFVRCCATGEELARLNNAKNQLHRALRLLGLPRRQDESAGAPTLAEWTADWRRRQNASAGKSSEESNESRVEE